MSKAPAFQLYAADFYMDTISWSPEIVGVYTRLLFYQWVNGSIPNDMEKIARIGGCADNRRWRANMDRMWRELCHKFATLPDGNLVNLRLEKTRQKQEQFAEFQREKANIRWNKGDAGAMPVHMPGQCPAHALQSSSSTSIKDKELKAEEQPVDNSDPDEQDSPPFPTEGQDQKTALKEEPKPEKQKPGNGKPDAYLQELQNLAAEVKTKYPKYAIESWYGKNRNAPPEKILQVLKSFLKAELKYNSTAVMEKYLQNSIDVEIGKHNAAKFDREQVGKKGPVTRQGMAAMRQILTGIGGR